MWRNIISRIRHYRAIIRRVAWRVLVVIPFALASALTFVRDEFLRPEWREGLKLPDWLPDIAWYWWIIFTLLLLIFFILEGSFREHRDLSATIEEQPKPTPKFHFLNRPPRTSISSAEYIAYTNLQVSKTNAVSFIRVSGLLRWTTNGKGVVQGELRRDGLPLKEGGISFQSINEGVTTFAVFDKSRSTKLLSRRNRL